jgi:hypothetical protein
MKYRDLIFVLMIVAVGVLWWSGPQTAASENEPQPEQTVSQAKPVNTPAASPMPPKIPVVKMSPIPMKEMDASDFPRPTLKVVAVGQPGSLQDLVIQAKLESEDPVSLHTTEDGKPYVSVTATIGDKYWTFRSVGTILDSNKSEPAKTLEWETRLSELQPPPNPGELESAFKTQEVQWVMSLDEAEEETNMMSRRVVMPLMGPFTTKP